MSDWHVPPHGGLERPVDRFVADDERESFEAHARALDVRVELSPADRSTFWRLADGTLSPLEGPMGRDAFQRVLDEAVLVRGDKRYAWTIPVSFPLADDEAQAIGPGAEVAVWCAGELMGTLEVSDVFEWDKAAYNRAVYGTERTDHPGARIALKDPRHWLCGGRIRALRPAPHPVWGAWERTPAAARELFAEHGYDCVVAFQTRNPLHRAHEYALVYAAEELTRQGHYTGVVLNPLVGETKDDDVDAATRWKTYVSLVERRLLGRGDKDEALWQRVGYDINDVLHLIPLDIKMFYAGPREAVMHAIYRQNLGCTHIVIGRKHADAPYDDGSSIWGDFDAHHIFDELAGELFIQPVKVGFAAYYESMGRVDLMERHPDEKPVFISGKRVRALLHEGKHPDPRIMRPETADILIEAFRHEGEGSSAG